MTIDELRSKLPERMRTMDIPAPRTDCNDDVNMLIGYLYGALIETQNALNDSIQVKPCQ